MVLFNQGDAEMIAPNIFSYLLMLSRKQVGKSVYTSPKQTALDLLQTQKISITLTSQKIFQERGDKSLLQKNSNCKYISSLQEVERKPLPSLSMGWTQ